MRRFKDPAAREFSDILKDISGSGVEVSYAVLKAGEIPAQRVTVGIVYAPGVEMLDAHGEWAGADDLEKSVGDYLSGRDFDINKQHGREVIGRITGIMAWPFEQTVELKSLGAVQKSARTVTLPAGTIYASAQWTPQAWTDVQSGAITGFSMEGRAVRVKE